MPLYSYIAFAGLCLYALGNEQAAAYQNDPHKVVHKCPDKTTDFKIQNLGYALNNSQVNELEVVGCKFEQTLGTSFLSRYHRVKALTVTDCIFGTVGERSFELNGWFELLAFNKCTFEGDLDEHAITFYSLEQCDSNRSRVIDLMINNSKIEVSQFRRNSIGFELNCNQQDVDFKFTYNQGKSAKFLPQEPFEPMFKLLNKDRTTLTLLADPIDCCLPESRWMFDYTRKYPNKTRDVRMFCEDLKEHTDVIRTWTKADLDAECDKVLSSPVLTIVISLILFLIGLMSILGAVCYFYIMPGNHLFLDQNTPLEHSSKDTSATQHSIKSSVQDDDKTRQEMKSTHTASTNVAAKQQPLLAGASVLGPPSAPKRASLLQHAKRANKSSQSNKSNSKRMQAFERITYEQGMSGQQAASGQSGQMRPFSSPKPASADYPFGSLPRQVIKLPLHKMSKAHKKVLRHYTSPAPASFPLIRQSQPRGSKEQIANRKTV